MDINQVRQSRQEYSFNNQSTWSITHNWNTEPIVILQDDSGNIIHGEVTYTNDNQISVAFKQGNNPVNTTGKATIY